MRNRNKLMKMNNLISVTQRWIEQPHHIQTVYKLLKEQLRWSYSHELSKSPQYSLKKTFLWSGDGCPKPALQVILTEGPWLP